MPVDREIGSPEIAVQEWAGAARSGFTDDAFDARYAGGHPVRLGSGAQAKPALTPSRNSYMRARARRLAASAPS